MQGSPESLGLLSVEISAALAATLPPELAGLSPAATLPPELAGLSLAATLPPELAHLLVLIPPQQVTRRTLYKEVTYY